MSVVTILVQMVGGDLAEENLARVTEENTVRDARHILSMLRGTHDGTAAEPRVGTAGSDDRLSPSTPLTLEGLASPQGLPGTHRSLVVGLNIAGIDLIDLNGTVVWSSDPAVTGTARAGSALFQTAALGQPASDLFAERVIVGLDGASRHIPVVETHLPVRATPAGESIGVLAIFRDVASDYAIQVADTRANILWITLGFMAILFVVFSVFVLAADLAIHRGNRREVALIEGRLAERKRSEEALSRQTRELKRSNAELEQFAYVASHDLQEPLRMVTSFTQLPARRYKGRLDEEADKYISFAADGAIRMSMLISDLLTNSQMGRAATDPGRVDCEAILATAVQNLQKAIRESGATVTHDPLPKVVGNNTQFVQLFQNLIGNAVKYQNGNVPEVHVAADRTDSGWRFSFRDNGIGIEPSQFERIFAIFQRLHTGEEYPGTGVGLALCNKIAERHGGSIWVESGPGYGSTFYVTISTSGEEPGGLLEVIADEHADKAAAN
jgi:signal transduction histidine kinase